MRPLQCNRRPRARWRQKQEVGKKKNKTTAEVEQGEKLKNKCVKVLWSCHSQNENMCLCKCACMKVREERHRGEVHTCS